MIVPRVKSVLPDPTPNGMGQPSGLNSCGGFESVRVIMNSVKNKMLYKTRAAGILTLALRSAEKEAAVAVYNNTWRP